MSSREIQQPRWARNSNLARYLGVSNMCLWRWQRDPEMNFPLGVAINKIVRTDLNEVDKWLRQHVVSRIGLAENKRDKKKARQTEVA